MCSGCGLASGGRRSYVRCPGLALWDTAARSLTCYRCPRTAPEPEWVPPVPASRGGLSAGVAPRFPSPCICCGQGVPVAPVVDVKPANVRLQYITALPRWLVLLA